jgi:uncharacterized membrane protein YphA (DoxX/SURF4 family)
MPLGEILVTFMRLLIASVFLMAGWTKASEGNRFVTTVRNFHLLPDYLVKPYAKLLPWLELFAGCFLFAGISITTSSLVALGLCITFIAATIHAIKSGLNLTCSCFGLLYKERIGPTTLGRDLVLVVCCSTVAAFDKGEFSLVQIFNALNNTLNVILLILTACVFGLSVALAYSAGGGFLLLRPPRNPTLPHTNETIANSGR